MRAAIRLMAVAAALSLSAATYANPVIAGDHPDPTVVRVGTAFYSSSTSSSWAPLFPLLRSTDLVSWRQVGALLPRAPAWATGRFWAPELVRSGHGMLAYFSADRAGGPPCLGVLSAPAPTGPWRDHGRAACPPGGAIDAAPARDADGSRWLLWKAAGRAGIRAARLRPGGLRTVGRAVTLIRPDAPWERGVVEGPAVLRRGGWLYLFFAGGGCCRPPCTYAEGIARARRMTGPWEQAPSPFLTGSARLRCPGHGTPVDLGGRGVWLLHHAVPGPDVVDAPRAGVLTPVVFGPDGWPLPVEPPDTAASPFGGAQRPPATGFADRFPGPGLRPGWEWLADRPPALRAGGGRLVLRCGGRFAFVARQVTAGRFAAAAEVDPRAAGGAAAGLGASLGRGVRGVEARAGAVRAFRVTPRSVRLGPAVVIGHPRRLRLVIAAAPDGTVTTAYSADGGPLTPVPAGPASRGNGPLTRVALSCRGLGAALLSAFDLRALPPPAGGA